MEPEFSQIKQKGSKQPQKFRLKQIQKVLISNYGTLFDLILYDNNKQVICSGNDHEITLLDIETAKKSLLLKGHHNTITKVAINRENPNVLMSTSADKTVIVWKIGNKMQKNTEDFQSSSEEEQSRISYFEIQNPDKKTAMGAAFIDEQRIVFGQCLNKAHFYNIQEKRFEHTYEFNVNSMQNMKKINTERAIYRDQITKKESSSEKDTQNEAIDEKPSQSWVTEIGYMEKFDLLIICENSRIHFLDTQTYKPLTIFTNTHSGHILNLKIKDNYILLGSSNSFTYLYEFDSESISLNLLLRIRTHESSIGTVDFWFDNKSQNVNESDQQNGIKLPSGGIITAAFDPIVKFYDFLGNLVFEVDNIASPFVWDSEKQILIGRDHNITRELAIQYFEQNY